MRCVKGRGVKEDLKSISEWVSACPLSYLLSSNWWYLPNYTYAHTHAHTRMKGYSHTVFFPPSISRPIKLTLLTDPPAIHLQSTAVDTQESRPTHTLMLFLPPWQEGLFSEPDDSLRFSLFPLLAGVRNKTINKCKREPETARERRTNVCLYFLLERGANMREREWWRELCIFD